MSKVDPVPYSFVANTTIDENQVNANFASIVADANANLAAAGVNSDITELTGISTLSLSGALAAGQLAISGTTQLTGDATLGGAITVPGLATFGGDINATGAGSFGGLLKAFNGFNVTGDVAGTGSATFGANLVVTVNGSVGGNLAVFGQIRTHGASPDTLYSSNGAIVLDYGSGIRAANTVSARGTVGSGSFNSAFGLSGTTHSGLGIYNFTFVQALQNNTYQVVASAAFTSGGVLLLPIVSNKGTNGFTLTYYSVATNGVADIGSGLSEIIVTGGN